MLTRGGIIGAAGVAANVGGPDVWYWSGTGKNDSSFSTLTTDGYNVDSYCYGAAITVAAGGTCTKIAGKASASSAGNSVKIAIYDSSGNRLSSGGQSGVLTVSSVTWEEITLQSPVEVIPGTYWVFMSGSSPQTQFAYDTGQNGLYSATTVTFANFPPATLSVGTEDGLYGVKMYVD
jgi:hypothetical protein